MELVTINRKLHITNSLQALYSVAAPERQDSQVISRSVRS